MVPEVLADYTDGQVRVNDPVELNVTQCLPAIEGNAGRIAVGGPDRVIEGIEAREVIDSLANR